MKSKYFIRSYRFLYRRCNSNWIDRYRNAFRNFKADWDEVDKATNQSIPDDKPEINYADLPLAVQKRIRELTWELGKLNIKDLENRYNTDPLFNDDRMSEAKKQSETAAVNRPKSSLESLLSKARSEVSQSSSPQNTANEDNKSSTNFEKLASENKEKLKVAAVSKLEDLEEVLKEFNDSYHISKKSAFDEVMAKEDYLESLKVNLLTAFNISNEKRDQIDLNGEKKSKSLNDP